MKQVQVVILALLGTLLILVTAPGAGGAAPAPPKKAEAEPSKKKGTEPEFPLHITAARLEADQNEGVVIFTGQVKAIYGDATLYADQLRVYFQKKPAAPKGAPAAAPAPAAKEKQAEPSPLGELGGDKLDRIVATGQVRLVQEDQVATGQQAIFYKDRDEVILTGNPQLWRAENTLKGERIIFNIKTNKMVAESSPQKRVEAVLYSQGGAGGKEMPALSPKPRKGRQP